MTVIDYVLFKNTFLPEIRPSEWREEEFVRRYSWVVQRTAYSVQRAVQIRA